MVNAVIALFLMAAPAPPGTLVDVGGYRVHLYCVGTGSPGIMIIGGFSFDWQMVQAEVAKFTRVCTYDASGTAWSDPGPQRPTCAERVQEIHQTLKTGTHVLVGFSTGALFARLYAKEYADDVVGMVIVDHAFLPPKTAPPPAVSGPDSPPALISATPVAIGVEDEPGYNQLPRGIRELHRWAESVSPGRPTAEMTEDCAAQVGQASLGSLPLAVVSTANDSPGYEELQKQLLALSRNSRQFVAARSFHSIGISQPEVVVDAIRHVVEATRK